MTRSAYLAAAALTLLAAPARAQDDLPPAPPAKVAASYATPALGTDGRYLTPNRGLEAAEVTWHLRSALNVAALGCPGAGAASGYNAFLAAEREPLAAAATGSEGAYRRRYGAAWRDRADGDATRVYNFFAQPEAAAAFCAAAADVLREAATVEPADFPAFAAAALPRLEAPFLAFYAAWDRYRADRAAWEGRHRAPAAGSAPAPVLAAAAPVAAVLPVPVPVPAPSPVPAPVQTASVAVPAGYVAVLVPVAPAPAGVRGPLP